MISLVKSAALLIAALLALAVVPVAGQQTEISPEHLGLARKYVDLTDKSEIYVVSLVETAMQTMQTIIKQNPDMVEPVDAAISKTLEGYKERKGELLDQFARVYALSFSMDELQAIVTFYESPVGQKLATANATLNESLQRVMQVFQTNLRTEFFAKVRAELKASGHDV